MTKTPLFKTIGQSAGFLAVPLALVTSILLLTYREFSLPVIALLIVFAVCIILYTLAYPETVARVLRRRNTQNVVTTIVIAVSVIGILILLNVLASRASWLEADTTQNQAFSLSPSTLKVIESVKSPTTVTVLYSARAQTEGAQARDRLDLYARRNELIKVQEFNISTAEGQTKPAEFGITSASAVFFKLVFQSGSQRSFVDGSDEQSITRALLKLQDPVERRVFFVTGHGEHSPTPASQNEPSVANLSASLTRNTYTVSTLNLQTLSDSKNVSVTLNTANDVLVFAGPLTPYSTAEKDNALRFLRAGGKALFLKDATTLLNPDNQQDNLNDLLADWNIKYQTGLVVETDPQQTDPRSPLILVPEVGNQSDILSGLRYRPVLPLTAGIDRGNNVSAPTSNGDGIVALFSSSKDRSFLETDKAALSNNTPRLDDKDVKGPVVVAASYQGAPKSGGNDKTRLVIFAGVTFASDQFLSESPANEILLINAVNWLTARPDAPVIQDRPADVKSFRVNQAQDTFLYYSTVFGLPLLVAFGGLFVWLRRR